MPPKHGGRLMQEALGAVQQGDRAAGVRAIAQFEAMGDSFLLTLRAEHWFDPLRKDPRFTALDAKIGFP